MRALREHVVLGENESFHVGYFPVKSTCDANYWHFHPEYEIVFIKNGTGTRVVGDHSSTYQNGELIFLGPNLPHLPFGNRQYPDNYEVVIQFNQELADQILAIAETKNLVTLLNQSHEGLAYGQTTKDIVSTYISQFQFEGMNRFLLLLRLLKDLHEAQDYQILNAAPLNVKRSNADLQRLEHIYSYVASNYQHTITIDEIAASVGLTGNSLCRFFKRVTGKTLTSFIHQFRVSIAKEGLRDGKANISEIAFRCGYNDLTFFNRKFKSNTGMTPTAYRKKFQSLSLSDYPLQ